MNTFRKLSRVLAVVAGLAPGCAAGQPLEDQDATRGYAFVNANVIDLRSGSVLERQTVLVRGDTIVAAGPAGQVELPDGVERVDATGRYVLPGLADMHVHLQAESELRSYLRFGVTTVLQMSTDSRTFPAIDEYRRGAFPGEMAGPTVYSTGPMFDRGRFSPEGRLEVAAADVPALLARHRADGYEFIKVHNMVPADVYRALVSSDMPVIGHMPFTLHPDDVLTSGQRMVAHAELFYYSYFLDRDCMASAHFWECAGRMQADATRIGEISRAVARAGITVTANLAILAADRALTRDAAAVLADPEFSRLAPQVAAAWRDDLPVDRSFREHRTRDLEQRYPFTRQLVKAFADAGVPLLAGSDAPLTGAYPGQSLHLELSELVKAGLTPLAALRTATTEPGRFIATHVPGAKPFGLIEPGYRADLLVVAGNPLRDIRSLTQVVATMAHGRYWTASMLAAAR